MYCRLLCVYWCIIYIWLNQYEDGYFMSEQTVGNSILYITIYSLQGEAVAVSDKSVWITGYYAIQIHYDPGLPAYWFCLMAKKDTDPKCCQRLVAIGSANRLTASVYPPSFVMGPCLYILFDWTAIGKLHHHFVITWRKVGPVSNCLNRLKLQIFAWMPTAFLFKRKTL